MFVTNRDAFAMNTTGVEITPGGAAAFIEDATKYFGVRKETDHARSSSLRPA